MAKQVDPSKIANLQSAMSRASKLMRLESNGTLDKIAKAHKGEINESLSSDGSMTTESMMTTARNRNTQAPIARGQMLGAGAGNVPSIIRESFANNPIDERALYAGLGDGRDLSFLNESMPTQQAQAPSSQEIRQIINESAPQTMQVPQQIDYPMIRTIVEEIVRKYAVSLKNKILTEDKQNMNEVNTVMLGKSFKFLAKNGDIYEAKLTKVGNINDKKKSVNE
jgi:hypothetical protein